MRTGGGSGTPGTGDSETSPTTGASSDSEPPLLPDVLREFLDLYAAGRFWDSHEALEGAWRASGSPFYQGLILYASAWVHWERGNAHGVRAQLRKALERWAPYPATHLGIELDELRRHARSVRAAVAAHPQGWRSRVAPLPLQGDPRRIRGDEPELDGRTGGPASPI